MKYCPRCRAPLRKVNQKFCYKCGYPLYKRLQQSTSNHVLIKPKRKNKLTLIGIGLVVLIVAIIFIHIGSTNHQNASNHAHHVQTEKEETSRNHQEMNNANNSINDINSVKSTINQNINKANQPIKFDKNGSSSGSLTYQITTQGKISFSKAQSIWSKIYDSHGKKVHVIIDGSDNNIIAVGNSSLAKLSKFNQPNN